MRLRRWVPAAVGTAGLLSALFVTPSGSARSGPRSAAAAPARAAAAEARVSGQDLGPVDPQMPLRLQLALAIPQRTELDKAINSGRSVGPAEYARDFLLPPTAVDSLVSQLDRAGLRAQWTPGTAVVEVGATAAAAERYFSVPVHRFRESDGTVDYGAVGTPDLTAMRGLVTAVAGFDHRSRLRTATGPRSAGGRRSASSGSCAPPETSVYTPSQIQSAYNFGPLAAKGFDGTGQTIVLLEIDTFDQADLDCFTSQYRQTPIAVTVADQNWGRPDDTDHGEADLDLEIIHSLAPKAHLVVYYSDASLGQGAAAAQAAIAAYPKAIFSVSLGVCEYAGADNGTPSPSQSVTHNALTQLAAAGGTMFVSSGDSGAFTCGPTVTDGNGAIPPTVSYPAADPLVTAVGGTALFLTGTGSYASEATWGGPFESSGGGGGVSAFWDRPDWQRGPGVENQYSDGKRQVPDVSAVADPNTGWEIYSNGGWAPTGGTSAAAPLWAALGALTDQALAAQDLAPLGFADPALYAFGQDPGAEPVPPFNDVTRGNNLYYPATPQWDDATGWGSPDAAGLVADLVSYRRANP